MNYTQAMSYLEDSNRYGSVLGLDSMKALLDRLGNPQDRLKFVHIAGTNGKGSTAAFIASILATAGYRVGRYISPAVFGYKEKIQISDKNQTKDSKQILMNLPFVTKYIKENNIAEYVGCIKTACDDMTALGMPHPTIFEMETAMAMIHFLNEKCDLVVLEVGLGGRLDATNIITNTECAVITSISMDHMHILGNTLELIAAEKAGIIKHDIEVISYKQELEAEKVIRKVCIEKQARLTEANFNHIHVIKQDLEGTTFSYEDLYNIHIHLLGKNQVKNAVVAILTVKALQRLGYKISEEEIRTGLFVTRWSGRFEIIKTNPYFIIDGAHNEDGAKALAENIQSYFNNRKIIYIMGVLADKDYDSILRLTSPFAKQIITITPNNARGLSSAKLAEAALAYCNNVIDAGTISKAISIANAAAVENDVIIAFGSLSYLNEVYEELGLFLLIQQ